MDMSLTPPSNNTQDGDGSGEIIFKIAGSVISVAVAAIGIVGNIIILVVIPRIPDGTLGEATRIFLSALALADLVTALTLLTTPIWAFYDEWVSNDFEVIFCQLIGFLTTCAPPVGASFIFLLNADRYFQVTRPFTYQHIATKKKAVVIATSSATTIVFNLLLSVAVSEKSFGIIRFNRELEVCLVDFSDHSFFPFTVVCFTISPWSFALLLLAMYARILHIARHHHRQISAQRTVAARCQRPGNVDLEMTDLGPGNDEVKVICMNVTHLQSDMKIIKRDPVDPVPKVPDSQMLGARKTNDQEGKMRGKAWMFKIDRNAFQQNLRTFRTPVIITGYFLLSWIPFTLALTYASASGHSLGRIASCVVASLAASNCVINIFVYVFTRNDFKKTLRKILGRRRL